MKKSCTHSKETRPALGDLKLALRKRSCRLTGPRQAILEMLRAQSHPLTNRQIFSRLPTGQADLATVYRSMHLLERAGMVKRFDFGDGVARYELVSGGAKNHHHHLICTGCAEVVEIADCFPSFFERKIARRNGFKAVSHKLEFFGVCPRCQ